MSRPADTAAPAASAGRADASPARVGLVWAEARGGVIGLAGVMPWHVPEDLAHFKAVTMGGAVVMGRKTWDSIPERFRPFSGRENIVLTRQPGWSAPGVHTAHSLADGIALGAGLTPGELVWVIGGAEVFAQAIAGQAQADGAGAGYTVDRIEVTEIDAEFNGDTHAPRLGPEWAAEAVDPASGWHTSRTGLPYRFLRHSRGSAPAPDAAAPRDAIA